MATVTAIEYSGLIWCPTVSTGAFVARRNGKVFITGNSGFPKSLNVAKAIESGSGRPEDIRRMQMGGDYEPSCRGRVNYDHGAGSAMDAGVAEWQPASEAARQWSGWGTALKPALEPITVARKPLVGNVASNVLAHGTGALNIDGCRVAGESTARHTLKVMSSKGAKGGALGNQEHNYAERDAAFATGSDSGRWPANLIHDGSDDVLALFPDSNGSGGSIPQVKITGYGDGAVGTGKSEYIEGQRTKHNAGTGSAARFFKQVSNSEDLWEGVELPRLDASTAEKNLSQQRQAAVSALVVAANSALPGGLYCSDIFLEPSTSATESELRLIASSVMQTIQSIGSKFWLEPEPARLSLSFNRASAVAIQRLTDTTTITVSHWKSDGSADPVTFSITRQSLEAGEKGCALSTDGKRLIYCAKASKNDRGEGNAHPTVKPTELMRYLCRLVTPPCGTVLDPFMGSGSTGKAALLEGFAFIGAECEQESFDTAAARIGFTGSAHIIAAAEVTQMELI